jgi:hypothetical protein
VGHRLQQLVSDTLTAVPAEGKNGIAHQDDRGPGIILMADFIDSGVLDQLSGIQGTVSLVKLNVFVHWCTLRIALNWLVLRTQHALGQEQT